jgi:hypothetical protein
MRLRVSSIFLAQETTTYRKLTLIKNKSCFKEDKQLIIKASLVAH